MNLLRSFPGRSRFLSYSEFPEVFPTRNRIRQGRIGTHSSGQHIGLHHDPALKTTTLEQPQDASKVDAALSNRRENPVPHGLIEIHSSPPRLFGFLLVHILQMDTPNP